MLSRTASSLYWLGRYSSVPIHRPPGGGDVRLDVLSRARPAKPPGRGALAVTRTREALCRQQHPSPAACRGFLTLDSSLPARSPLPRHGAQQCPRRPYRELTREAWTAIQPRLADIRQSRESRWGNGDACLVDAVKTEARGFRGRDPPLAAQPDDLVHPGSARHRARRHTAAAARTLKYHLLLPEGEQVGGRSSIAISGPRSCQNGVGRHAFAGLYSEG